MLDWQNVNREGQAVVLDRGFTMCPDPGSAGYDLWLQIHHDTSYAKQSHAKISVFNKDTLTWNLLSTVHFDQWASERTPESGATEGLWCVAAELEARAAVILFPNNY